MAPKFMRTHAAHACRGPRGGNKALGPSQRSEMQEADFTHILTFMLPVGSCGQPSPRSTHVPQCPGRGRPTWVVRSRQGRSKLGPVGAVPTPRADVGPVGESEPHEGRLCLRCCYTFLHTLRRALGCPCPCCLQLRQRDRNRSDSRIHKGKLLRPGALTHSHSGQKLLSHELLRVTDSCSPHPQGPGAKEEGADRPPEAPAQTPRGWHGRGLAQ